jgi:hypothetical protein
MLFTCVVARQTHASREWDDRCVPAAKRKRTKRDDPLAPYRRIRKPMPPPEKVIGDRRRDMHDEDARREIDDATRRGRGRYESSPNEDAS